MAEKKRFLLRLDPRLYAALESWASDEFRSVNAQIEMILVEAVRKAGRNGRLGKEPDPDPMPDHS